MSVIEGNPVRKRLAVAGIALSMLVATGSVASIALLTWWQVNLPDFDFEVHVASSNPPALETSGGFDFTVFQYSRVSLSVQGDVGVARVLEGMSRALTFSIVPAGALVVLWVCLKYLRDQRLATSVSVSIGALGAWMILSTVASRALHVEAVAAAVEAVGLSAVAQGNSDVVILPSFWVDDLVRMGLASGIVLLIAAALVRWGNAAHDELARVV